MPNEHGFQYLAARYLELCVEIEVGDGQLSGVAIDGVVATRDAGGGYRHSFGVAHGVIGKDVTITAKAARTSPSDHVSLTVRFYQVLPAGLGAAPGSAPERFRPQELVTQATFGGAVEVPLAMIVRIA